jgi:hypothetical protein
MNKKYYRIVVDELYKCETGDIMVRYSVYDTRNDNLVLKGERIVEIDIVDEAKEDIMLEVKMTLDKMKEGKLN